MIPVASVGKFSKRGEIVDDKQFTLGLTEARDIILIGMLNWGRGNGSFKGVLNAYLQRMDIYICRQ